MSRPHGPISLGIVAICGTAAGCLGDVPPFQGGGGSDGTSSATQATTGSAPTTASSGPAEGGGSSTSSTSSTGEGGQPAAGVSGSSGAGGAPCSLDAMPEGCAGALDALACAGFGGTEACAEEGCPDGDCAFPIAVLLHDPREGFCTTAAGSVEEVCLWCDGAGPGIALAEDGPVDPLALAAFPPGMPAIVKIVARGRGTFQLQWWEDADSNGISELFTLSEELAGFDVPFPSSSSFELRVVPGLGGDGNDPFWMELDCAYTVDTASTAAPVP